MSKFLIIDANSILNRAFYAIRPLTNSEGLNTNGIYGFLNILLKELSEEKPDYIACAFDVSRVTFRTEIFPDYKGTRGATPDELKEQFEPLKKVLRAMNIAVLEMPGFEADDIIGSVAKKCEKNGTDCVILTGDKDDLQLISDNVFVKLIITRMGKTDTNLMDKNALFEKYGLTPPQMIELKALMGDKSDNIPGVKGVGEVTGLNLIKEYGTLENIYENIENIKGSLQTKLISEKENAFLSRTLGTIKCDLETEGEIEDYAVKEYNQDALREILTYLNFEKILERLSLESGENGKKQEKKEISVLSEAEFEKAAVAEDIFYLIDTENVCITADGSVYTVSRENKKFKEILSDSTKRKISLDIKSQLHNGFSFNGEYCDIGIMAYSVDPKNTFNDILKFFGRYIDTEVENIIEASFYLPQLFEKLKKEIEENNLGFINETEHKLIKILYDMECFGVKIDVEKLDKLDCTFKEKTDELLKKIYILAGEEFNVSSPKQLGEILFVKLGLPVVKKTKTGYSTNAEVLEELSGTHEIIDYIKEYRTLTKLVSTYIEGFRNAMDENSVIHTTFNQTLTLTGRLSSTEPNLQNIPVRTDEGRLIRSVVLAKNDFFVTADYSQIELRVLADICGDKNLIDAFRNDFDIHTSTAENIFDTQMVTPDMRRAAKAINFGLIYGKGAFSLAKDLKITRKEAVNYIDRYFGKYPDVKGYMKNVVENAEKIGYTVTAYGRRRYFPELKAKGMIKAAGERAALNSPIQGTAADIIKLAMINVDKAIKEKNLKSRLSLQIHDELIIDCVKEEKEIIETLLKEEMEKAAVLKVPLTVSLGEGKNLDECK